MFEIILVQGFCPLKIKITQFPNGFHQTKNCYTETLLFKHLRLFVCL